VLSLDDWERRQREICASGPASSGDNLAGVAMDFDWFLGDDVNADEDPGLWQNMDVQRDQAPDG
jgi:hypothetical protein